MKPTFINADPAATLAELIDDYQARTGKTLLPAQAERLLINSVAYAITLFKAQANEAALQGVVDFSSAPVLDRLGDLVGVTRLPASKAVADATFTLVTGHGGVTIPKGTRIGTIDGVQVFQIIEDIEVEAGTDVAQGSIENQVAGASGNGFAIGAISTILDPLAFLSAAANTEESAGGANEESDDAMRVRIKQAPASFSTCGSEGAYRFFAKSASVAIIDVAVTSPSPGTVNIYPLIAGGGTTPAPILALVEDAVNADTVRPLTDTVNVISPTSIAYDIEIDVVLLESAVQSAVEAQISANLAAFAGAIGGRLGSDAIISRIVAAAAGVAGVYDASVLLPDEDIIVDATEVAIVGDITINFVGTNEG
jgi:phage-related baseplate assembly protein